MTQQQEEQQLDRKDLKILALIDSVSKLQDENADLRVELTILSHQAKDLQEKLDEDEKENSESVPSITSLD